MMDKFNPMPPLLTLPSLPAFILSPSILSLLQLTQGSEVVVE